MRVFGKRTSQFAIGLVSLVIVNELFLGALSTGGAAATQALGPTGDNIIYAALFLFLTARAVGGLVRRVRRETADFAENATAKGAGLHFSLRTRLPWLTLGIIGLTSIISLFALDMFYAAPRDVPLFSALYLSPPLVAAGQVWRLVTVTLVHGSSLHLAFNMAALWWLGITEHGEARLGRPAFLLIYLAAATAASFTSLVFVHQPAVGASGAIMGMLGAMLVFTALDLRFLRWAIFQAATKDDAQTLALLKKGQGVLVRRIEILGLIAVATLASGPLMGQAGVVVDNFAHAGGLLAGIVAGLIITGRSMRGIDKQALVLTFVDGELAGSRREAPAAA